MKSRIFKSSWAFLAVIIALAFTLSNCNKEDALEPITKTVNVGTDKVNTLDGTWLFDKSHSNVTWETLYFGKNAWLTGRFNTFLINIDFDQANLTNSKIEASVKLSTANTGEPGRDGLGKCLNASLGIKTDTTADGKYFVSDTLTDVATWKSTSIVRFGEGYKALGTLNFRGVSKPSELYFTYTGISTSTTSSGATETKAGFCGQFKFNALSDYGVTSTSINDEVIVKINYNVRKKPQ